MLDSLVRVSRRVGWATDLLAADHKCHHGSSVQPTAGPESPAATRGVQQPGALPAKPATARLSRRRARARVSNASSVGRRSRVKAGYNSDRSRSCNRSYRWLTGNGYLPCLAVWPPIVSPNRSRRPTEGEVRPTAAAAAAARSIRIRSHRAQPTDGLNPPVRPSRAHPFASERFHVLLNSLFKVLCNFPSRYLFAIGLVEVFSLRWSLPPA